jgi:uncharacterized protein YigE (DUF2233 family)
MHKKKTSKIFTIVRTTLIILAISITALFFGINVMGPEISWLEIQTSSEIALAPTQKIQKTDYQYFSPNSGFWDQDTIVPFDQPISNSDNLTVLLTIALDKMGYQVTPQIINETLNPQIYTKNATVNWDKINTVYPNITYDHTSNCQSDKLEADLQNNLLPILEVKVKNLPNSTNSKEKSQSNPNKQASNHTSHFVMLVGSQKKDLQKSSTTNPFWARLHDDKSDYEFLVLDPQNYQQKTIALKNNYSEVISCTTLNSSKLKDTTLKTNKLNSNELTSTKIPHKKWTKIDKTVKIREFKANTDYPALIRIYQLDKKYFQPHIVNTSQPTALPSFLTIFTKQNSNTTSNTKDSSLSGILINGTFFESDYTPSGYMLIDGKRIGENVLSPEISGVFLINKGKPEILPFNKIQDSKLLDDENISKHISLIQSFPILILNGEININKNWKQTAYRSAIGIDTQGNTYLITTHQSQISLYDLAEELMATGIDFQNVLNLDGGSSTSISVQLPSYQFTSCEYCRQIPNALFFKLDKKDN